MNILTKNSAFANKMQLIPTTPRTPAVVEQQYPSSWLSRSEDCSAKTIQVVSCPNKVWSVKFWAEKHRGYGRDNKPRPTILIIHVRFFTSSRFCRNNYTLMVLAPESSLRKASVCNIAPKVDAVNRFTLGFEGCLLKRRKTLSIGARNINLVKLPTTCFSLQQKQKSYNITS